MADIRLAKPAAGTSQNVVCTPDARFVFEFPTDEAMLSRNGDNLVITFEDGSTLQLENFYTAYSSENMPSFSVDGAEISGQDFFTAMNEPDLMPAAGPAGNAGNQSNGNRFHDYVNADLLDGLDRLGGLDIGWPGSDVNPETDGAATSGDYIPEEIDTVPPTVSITLELTTSNGDKILNIEEAAAKESVTLRGTVTVNEDATNVPSSVELKLGDKVLGTADLVSNGEGTYSYELKVDGSEFKDSTVQQVTTEITVSDAAGNTAHDEASDGFTVDIIKPTVEVKITTDADDSGHINASELKGTEGKINAHVTLGDTVKVGDTLVVKDQSGKELFNGAVTEEMLRDGLDVELSKPEGNNVDVKVTAEVKDTAGNSDTAEDAATLELEPGISVSNDNLKTDESYISDGSQEAPDGGEGSSASSNTDSGTLTVDTHGQEGTLIITVGSKQHEVILNADGTLARNQSTSFDTQYGTITLANGEDGITYTYTQTKNFIHSDEEPNNPDEAVNAESESFTVQVQDSNGNTSGSQTITVTIEDDAPSELTNEMTGHSQDWHYLGAKHFDFTSRDGWGELEGATTYPKDDITFSVATVHFEENGTDVKNVDWTPEDGGGLHFNDYGNGWWEDPKGLGVIDSPVDEQIGLEHGNEGRKDEIGYNHELHQSDAIVIDLGDKIAFNMNIELTDFIGSEKESVLIQFYRDGVLIDTEEYTNATAGSDGGEIGQYLEFPGGGFDKVVISAMHNGQNTKDDSDFTIKSIDFNVFEKNPQDIYTGQLSSRSADGIRYVLDKEAIESEFNKYRIELSWNDDYTQLIGTNYWGITQFIVSVADDGSWTYITFSNNIKGNPLHFVAVDGDGDKSEVLEVKVNENDAWPHSEGGHRNLSVSANETENVLTAAAAVGVLAAMPDTVEASESISPVEEMDDVSITPETTSSVSSTAENAPEIGIDNNTVETSDTLAALMDETAWADDNGGLLFDKLDALDADGLMSFADNLERQTRQSDKDGTDDSAAMNDTEATESLAAVSGNGVLLGDDEDNQLFGGEGDDYLFGMNGNDYLDGGEGSDYIFAGSGDDVIVYDGSDYLIDGGDGIDFMVSTDEGLSLDKLLTESGRDGNDGPIVNDVEVLITGKDALSLTNTEQLAKEYGITIGTDTNGDETLTLDMSKWQDNGNGSFDYIGQEGVDLTLETNLTPAPDTGDAEVQTQVFILNNTQG